MHAPESRRNLPHRRARAAPAPHGATASPAGRGPPQRRGVRGQGHRQRRRRRRRAARGGEEGLWTSSRPRPPRRGVRWRSRAPPGAALWRLGRGPRRRRAARARARHRRARAGHWAAAAAGRRDGGEGSGIPVNSARSEI